MYLADAHGTIDNILVYRIMNSGRHAEKPFTYTVGNTPFKCAITPADLTAAERAWNITILPGTGTQENGDFVFNAKFNYGDMILQGNSQLLYVTECKRDGKPV